MSNSEDFSALRTGAPSVPVPPMRATLVMVIVWPVDVFEWRRVVG
jgi:hypothetical protein